MNIEIISGSPRENSLSRPVALFLKKYFLENTPHSIGLIDMQDWEPQVDKKFDRDGKLLDESFYNTIHNFATEYLWLTENLVQNKVAA